MTNSRVSAVLSTSLRAQRSNPEGNVCSLDCFVASAPRNDGEMLRRNMSVIRYPRKPFR
jgi:hypothetical protein